MNSRYQASGSGYEQIDYTTDYTSLYSDIYDCGFIFVDEEDFEADSGQDEIGIA